MSRWWNKGKEREKVEKRRGGGKGKIAGKKREEKGIKGKREVGKKGRKEKKEKKEGKKKRKKRKEKKGGEKKRRIGN